MSVSRMCNILPWMIPAVSEIPIPIASVTELWKIISKIFQQGLKEQLLYRTLTLQNHSLFCTLFGITAK